MQLSTSATQPSKISEKLAEEAINYQDDPFKDLAAGELEETIN